VIGCRSHTWDWVGWAALGALALVVCAGSLHGGLIYPDGYQYLLMARGIATHLIPTVQLGHGGVLFVPSVDSSLKPLFPGLVALLSPVLGPREAADALTVAAGATTVLLAGGLALRLTGSWTAAAIAATAALTSPVLRYWGGFVGPDPLAEALLLATALAAVCGRPAPAGVLGAMCAATRPEWAVVLVGGGLAALARPALRQAATTALLAGAFTLAAVVAIVQPPLTMPTGGVWLLLGALGAGVAVQLVAARAAATPRLATAVVAIVLVALAAVALSGQFAALRALVRDQWPLLALAAWGLLRACSSGRALPALMRLAVVVLAGAIYAYRNAGSERYLAQLLPLVCVAAGLAAGSRPEPMAIGSARPARRVTALRLGVPAAALALATVVSAPRPQPAPDTFAVIAHQLVHAPAGMLVTAAPDAYGFLLPDRPEQELRPGMHGLILLDGAQRTYAPGLSARGVVLAHLRTPYGFERPNGTIDTGPALLVRGIVVVAGSKP